MSYQKGSAAVWIIAILVIVIVAGAAYWYWVQNSSQPTTSATTETPTTSTNPTSVQQQVNTSPTPQTNSDQPSLTDFDHPISVMPTSGTAPLTVTIRGYGAPADEFIKFGDGQQTDYYCADNVTTCPTRTHTYAIPGTYTISLYRTTPSIALGSVTVTVK